MRPVEDTYSTNESSVSFAVAYSKPEVILHSQLFYIRKERKTEWHPLKKVRCAKLPENVSCKTKNIPGIATFHVRVKQSAYSYTKPCESFMTCSLDKISAKEYWGELLQSQAWLCSTESFGNNGYPNLSSSYRDKNVNICILWKKAQTPQAPGNLQAISLWEGQSQQNSLCLIRTLQSK